MGSQQTVEPPYINLVKVPDVVNDRSASSFFNPTAGYVTGSGPTSGEVTAMHRAGAQTTAKKGKFRTIK